MKISKKQVMLLAGLACVVLLLLLLMNMCGHGETQTPTEPTEPAVTTEVTEQTEATAEQTEEATEATEETTEATEETTEATEPTTGNTRPGGTSGYNPGTGNTNTPSEDTTPKAGSADSPYLEFVRELPGQFQTVAVPAKGTVYQNIIGLTDCVLTIDNGEAYVVYGEKTIEPDEWGVVTVEITAPETENAPVTLQIGNKADQDQSFQVSFCGPLGSMGNPEPLTVTEGTIHVNASLSEGDADGYFYSFTAEENSRLTLQVDKITENTACEIIVTVNETVTKLSDCEDGLISVEVKQEETALIQVIAVPAEDGTYPAVDVEISGTVESAPGSSANPIEVFGEFPIVTDEIAPGGSVFYSVYGANDMVLTVESGDACITVDGVTYAPVDGVITAVIPSGNPRNPVTIVIGNSGEEASAFTLNLTAPVGSQSNPDTLTEGINTASIQAGDPDGYWYRWTAETDGVVTITMPEGNWVYQVNHTSGENVAYGDTQWSDSDPVVSVFEAKVLAGDILDLMINTYDPEDMWSNPAGEISVQMSVVQHVDVTYRGAELMLQPGKTVFCKAMLHAENIIMKVAGQGAFTVNVDGRDYASAEGLVTVEGIKTTTYDPKVFTITNDSDAAVTYQVSFENPVGSSANPAVISEMGRYTAMIIGDGEGYFYTWTATADGELTVELLGDDWAYTINNLTSYIYGESHVSDRGDPASEQLTVKAGDEIQINLGTASRENKQVEMEVSFQSALVEPVDVTFEGATLNLQPGQTVSCNAQINAQSIILKVTGNGAFTVSVGGLDYQAVNGQVRVEDIASTFYAPAEFSITNQADTAVQYTVRYENPVGSMENPEAMTQMGDYRAKVQGEGSGYYYSWIATEDGELTLEMDCNDWSYTINNLTSYQYGDNQVSTEQDASACQTVTVKAGDRIQIILSTASREDGEVAFQIRFQKTAEPESSNNSAEQIPSGGVESETGETENPSVEENTPQSDTAPSTEEPSGETEEMASDAV